MRKIVHLAFCLLCLAFSGQALAAGKLALVIGNGAYVNATELPNPPNDAADMAKVLGQMGFDVISAINAPKVDMDAKIREFAERAEAADVALFFYAGHGMQVNGINYLIPIDAKLETTTALDFETVNAESVIRYMSSDTRIGLVFLDACRDNPLSRRFQKKARSAAVGAGLATRTGSDPNLLIAFATAPGETALDGTGRNSPFTSALIKYLPQQKKELRSVLTDVKAEVQHTTDRQQIPWSHDNLVANVFLDGAPDEQAPTPVPAAVPVVETPAAPQPAPAPSQADDARQAWEIVKDMTTPAAFDVLAARYPGTFYAELARARATELRAQGKARIALAQPAPAVRVTQQPAQADEPPPQRTRSSLRWAVIIGSYPRQEVSKARSRLKQARNHGLDARLISTDDYGLLVPGLYAVVVSATSRGNALELVPEVQQYFGDAYAKQLQ